MKPKGYYWALKYNKWCIVLHYGDGSWFQCGSEVDVNESYFDQIGLQVENPYDIVQGVS